MINLRPSNSLQHTVTGTWAVGCCDVYEQGKRVIDANLAEIVGKKVIFIAGGIGRIAAYASSKGVDAYNLDISDLYQQLCFTNYPDVTYIKANMCFPIEGYDYAFFEDCITGRLFSTELLITINHWQKVAKILPKTYSLYVYRFNSPFIDSKIKAPEPEGTLYLERALNSGQIIINCDYDEVEDLDIEEILIDLNKPIHSIKVDPYTDKKYTAIGIPHAVKDSLNFADTGFRATIFNKGLYYSLLRNSIEPTIPTIPERYRAG